MHGDIVLNTLRPRQNGRHFADDIFKGISLNENLGMLHKISLKYVSYGLIDYKAANMVSDNGLAPNMLITSVPVNSLDPGGCGSNFKSVIFKHVLLIKFMTTCEIGLMNATAHLCQHWFR